MKSTDRQIQLILHFMQVCAEQEAAVFSSPTCPHAEPVPDTHNTRMWLSSCLISAMPLVWDTKAITRFALSGDITIASGRSCDSPRKEITLSALVLTDVVSHFRLIFGQSGYNCSDVLVCPFVCVYVCVGGVALFPPVCVITYRQHCITRYTDCTYRLACVCCSFTLSFCWSLHRFHVRQPQSFTINGNVNVFLIYSY